MPKQTPIRHASVADDVATLASKVVLGDGQLDSATSPQLLEVIALASAICDAARAGLDASVHLARQRRCTWAEIGQALGVSRQAVYRRFGREAPDRR